MSVVTEIERIQQDKNKIKEKLIALGLADSTSNLDKLAEAIENIVNQGAVQATVYEGETYTIPAGYHNGSGTVTGLTDTSGDYERYKLQAKTVMPTKQQQSVAPDNGYYGLSSVTINSIPETYQDVSNTTATAEDVLANKLFVTANGVLTAGTMLNNGVLSGSIDGLLSTLYVIPAGYTAGGMVTLSDDIERALAEI